MSLTLSFKPLPTLHVCASVPIEWTYTGNTTAAQRGGEGIKLVFVSASATTTVSSQSTAAASSSRVISTSTPPRTSTTSSRPTPSTSSSRPSSTTTIRTIPTTATASSRTIARRAPTTTPFSKTVTTVPLSTTSVGWPTIALPSGTYDLSAYLVATAGGGAESLVGVQRGVMVVQGTETGCLASTTTSNGISTMVPTTTNTGLVTASSAQSTGVASNGGAVVGENEKSSNKGGLIGGIVGSVLGVLLLACIAFFLIRRRRRHGTHQVLGTPRLGLFSRKKKDRGVGSAFNYDFGTLGSGSGGTMMDSSRRSGAGGGMTQVSGPMDVAHFKGLGATFGTTSDEEENGPKEKGETYGMVPVLARGDTDQSSGTGYVTSLPNTRGYRPPSEGMEFLASSAAAVDSSFPVHSPASDQSHSNGGSPRQHDRNPSDSSYTTGQSHTHLISRPPIAFPSSESTPESRRASVGTPRDPVTSIGRRSSATPSITTTQQRRKSSIAGGGGGGVERSGSVRRKPVPAVEAYEDSPGEMTPGAAGGSDEVAPMGQRQGIVNQKSFVLDVERPLER